MTGRGIDHVVLAVGDLDAAAARYQALGFTLTPRARHEDRMGTSNRLIQFADRTFIEVLEVDRPDRLMDHDFAARPPVFSFGAHNRAAAGRGDGISFLVFRSDDAQADAARFGTVGGGGYAPFDFQRQAILPDGGEAKVSFSLAFAVSEDAPDAPVFTCRNRAPEHFWKPAYQTHANAAGGIAAVCLVSEDPRREAAFLGGLFGGDVSQTEGGCEVAAGQAAVRVLSPDAVAEMDADRDGYGGPRFAGVVLRGKGRDVGSGEGCGMFLRFGG